jgi:hypothetical protein
MVTQYSNVSTIQVIPRLIGPNLNLRGIVSRVRAVSRPVIIET